MSPVHRPLHLIGVLAALVSFGPVVLAGCSNEPAAEGAKPIAFPQGTLDASLVGTWTPDGGETVLVFKEDGSFVLKIDKTVDMQMGGGIQRIQRGDTGRWTSHDGAIFIQHSDGLVLAYEIVPEDKPDELHLVVKGQKKPVVYVRHTAEPPPSEGPDSATQPDG
ncbi:MAG: hypothetical protein SNJ74_08585 [Fimbriimonadaceae bacterium]